jgi:HK97 family phage major capsid protein
MPVDIPGLRQKRAEKQDRMEQIVAQAANEDRDMSEVEKLAFDELDAEVDALTDQIERAEKVQKLKAATAVPVTADALRPAPAPAPAEARAPEEKGIVLARIVRSLIAERGSARAAQQFAVEQWGPEGEVVAKALAAGSSAAGASSFPTSIRPRSSNSSTSAPSSAAPARAPSRSPARP